jgi:hypothetical protein
MFLALCIGPLSDAHGQPPAAPNQEAGKDKGKLPDKASSQGPKKMSRFASKELARTQAVLRVLEDDIDMKDLLAVPQMKLRDVLRLLESNLHMKGKELLVEIDDAAFQADNPDFPTVGKAECSFNDSVPDRLPPITILRHALAQVPTRNATFVIRRGVLVITTTHRASARGLLTENVDGSFHEVPLGEALLDLAAQTGLALQLDPRANAKLDQPVTATFANNTSLKAALIVLADQAGLRLVMLGDVGYITTPENARSLESLRKEMNTEPPAPKQEKANIVPGLGYEFVRQ